MKAMRDAPGPPKRTAADNSSVEAYQAYQRRSGEAVPRSRIRSMYVINPDGSIGNNRTPPYVGKEIDGGSISKDYRSIDSLVGAHRRPAGTC